MAIVKTCDGSIAKERKIHKALKKFHVRGEWFKIEALEIAKQLFDSIPNASVLSKGCDPMYFEILAEEYSTDPYFEILAEDYAT